MWEGQFSCRLCRLTFSAAVTCIHYFVEKVEHRQDKFVVLASHDKLFQLINKHLNDVLWHVNLIMFKLMKDSSQKFQMKDRLVLFADTG